MKKTYKHDLKTFKRKIGHLSVLKEPIRKILQFSVNFSSTTNKRDKPHGSSTPGLY